MFVTAKLQGLLANNLFQYTATKMGNKFKLSYMYNSLSHSNILLNEFIFSVFAVTTYNHFNTSDKCDKCHKCLKRV